MTIPNSFASVTSATGQQLDDNFAAVGRLTVIPCSASGTNAITLTPFANSTTPSYSNYTLFSFVAAASNTDAVTVAVGTLPSLRVYKDGPSGPALLVTGDIIASTAQVVMYDSTLNGGVGGWHLLASNTLSGAYLKLTGGTLTGALVGTTVTAPAMVAGTVTSTVASVTQALSGNTVNVGNLIVNLGSVNVGTITFASLSTVVIGPAAFSGGTTLTRLLSTTSTITFPSIVPNSSADRTVTLTGVSVNDSIMIGPPASVTSGIVYDGYVPAAGSVIVRAANVTAATTITPAAALYRVTAIGFQ